MQVARAGDQVALSAQQVHLQEMDFELQPGLETGTKKLSPLLEVSQLKSQDNLQLAKALAFLRFSLTLVCLDSHIPLRDYKDEIEPEEVGYYNCERMVHYGPFD